MRLLFFIYISLSAINLYAQETPEEWKNQYMNTNVEHDKKDLLMKITDYYLFKKKDKDSVSKYLLFFDLKSLNNSDSLFIAEKLKRLSNLNFQISNYITSIQNAKKSIYLFEKNDEVYKSALVKRNLGNTLQVLFKNNEALKYFNASYNILKGEDRITMLIGMGAVHSQLNNLDKSIRYYNEATTLSKNLKINKYSYNIYNGMAIVYDKNKDTDKVIEMLAKALSVSEKQNNYLGQVVCLHNLGIQYLDDNNNKAKYYFEKAIKLFHKIDNEYMKASVYSKYSKVLLNLGSIEKASTTLDKSEIIFNKIENTGRMPMILNIRANIELKKGNKLNAIDLLNSALDLDVAERITGIRADNYLDLAKIYRDTNNAQKSFEAFENYVRVTDSISSKIKIKEIEVLKTKFEVNELEQNLKLKEQDLSILSEKNKTSNYRNILLLLFSTGLIFFIYKQQKLSKARRKTLLQEKKIISLNESLLKDKVKYTDTQITKYAIHIDERNKFLEQVKSQIKKIYNLSSDKEQRTKITLLQIFIKDNISVRKEKINLDKEVTTTTERYIYNLEKKFLNLTEKEIIVCKLLSLNLSSKQIAEKMEISLQSVNNYRSSIRKKIKLDSGDNLKRFLKNL